MLTNDWTMAHSLLSVPLNLGVLDPRQAIDAALAADASGAAPLASVEGFVRQVAGWRDYVWHLDRRLGDDYGPDVEALGARPPAAARPPTGAGPAHPAGTASRPGGGSWTRRRSTRSA